MSSRIHSRGSFLRVSTTFIKLLFVVSLCFIQLSQDCAASEPGERTRLLEEGRGSIPHSRPSIPMVEIQDLDLLLTPVSSDEAQKNFTSMVKALKFFYDEKFRSTIAAREAREGRRVEDYQRNLLQVSWSGQEALKAYLVGLSEQVNTLIALIPRFQQTDALLRRRIAELEEVNRQLRAQHDRRDQPAQNNQSPGVWSWLLSFFWRQA